MNVLEQKLESTLSNRGFIYSFIFHLGLAALFIFGRLPYTPEEHEQSFMVEFEDEERPPVEPESEKLLVDAPLVQTQATQTDNNQQGSRNNDAGAAKGTDPHKVIGASTGTNKNPNPASTKSGGSNQEEILTTQESDYAVEQKKKYSDLFGTGSGSGSGSSTGNNNPDGMNGDNGGLPNASALDGLTKGSGKVGGGLNGRGVVHTPQISDKSQKTGRVAINICVNSSGDVISTSFTQKNSTTSDSYLINLALNAAKKYKFAKSSINEQCGTVTIEFKVQ